jgi:spermidine export protein MdtI
MLENRMMNNIAFFLAFLAGVLDVGANLASTQSKGFTRPTWGLLSIALVLCAFACLAEATKVIDLPVAYAILGATGIFGTAVCERIFFGNRLKRISWYGFAMVFAAVVVLQSTDH